MSKTEQKSRDPGIQSGDLVLVRLPKGDIKSVKVEKNTCVTAFTITVNRCSEFNLRTVVIPKFGPFFANELVGHPYGLTYEIQDKKLTYVPPRTLEEIGAKPWSFTPFSLSPFFSEDTDATNELINDGEFVQPLTVDEIQALKRSGVHATVCDILFGVSSVFSLQYL